MRLCEALSSLLSLSFLFCACVHLLFAQEEAARHAQDLEKLRAENREEISQAIRDAQEALASYAREGRAELEAQKRETEERIAAAEKEKEAALAEAADAAARGREEALEAAAADAGRALESALESAAADAAQDLERALAEAAEAHRSELEAALRAAERDAADKAAALERQVSSVGPHPGTFAFLTIQLAGLQGAVFAASLFSHVVSAVFRRRTSKAFSAPQRAGGWKSRLHYAPRLRRRCPPLWRCAAARLAAQPRAACGECNISQRYSRVENKPLSLSIRPAGSAHQARGRSRSAA